MESNKTPSLILGFGLIIFSFFLLGRLLFKLESTTQIVDYWPVFILFIGLLTINPKNARTNGISLALIGLGIFGVLYRVGVFQTQGGQALLAVMLGLVGLVVLVLIVSRPRKPKVVTTNTQQVEHEQPINKSNRF